MTFPSFYVQSVRALAVGALLSIASGSRAAEGAPAGASTEDMTDLQRRVAALEAAGPSVPGNLSLRNVSLNLQFAAGGSSVDGEDLEGLQGGRYDPARNGFTLQQTELSFAGAVDPYVYGEAHVLILEDGAQLEEAFATSTALPAGLEAKGGYYRTEFGRENPAHEQSRAWLDQPVIATRLLGSEGLRAAGLRLSWLLPAPWHSRFLVGVQNPDDGSAVSFLGDGPDRGRAGAAHPYDETIGGRPAVGRDVDGMEDLLYAARWENRGDLGRDTSAGLGLSALSGPNATGEEADTAIFGADLSFQWQPAGGRRGHPFVAWQAEVMKRDFEADAAPAAPGAGRPGEIAGATLKDWGLVSELLWGFAPGWETGMRVDYATGNNEGDEVRAGDPSRCDRFRASPLIAWRPSEHARVRLQYNYDDSDALPEGEAHSVWAGFEFRYGAPSAPAR